MKPFDRVAAQGLGAHTPQRDCAPVADSAPSAEVASLKEGFRYGVGVGLVVGLGAALITFVVGIALGGVL